MHLQTDRLSKRYDNFALSIPDLTIESGTAFGLVGNNGAGKTTFLRLVLDLIRADEGHVALGGEPVADAFDWKTRTGSYLGPSFLIDFLTPDENGGVVGQTYDLDEATVNERLPCVRGPLGFGPRLCLRRPDHREHEAHREDQAQPERPSPRRTRRLRDTTAGILGLMALFLRMGRRAACHGGGD